MHEVGMPVGLRDTQNAELWRERIAARAGVVALAGASSKRACGCACDRISGSGRGPRIRRPRRIVEWICIATRVSSFMRFEDGTRIAFREVMKLRLLL